MLDKNQYLERSSYAYGYGTYNYEAYSSYSKSNKEENVKNYKFEYNTENSIKETFKKIATHLTTSVRKKISDIFNWLDN